MDKDMIKKIDTVVNILIRNKYKRLRAEILKNPIKYIVCGYNEATRFVIEDYTIFFDDFTTEECDTILDKLTKETKNG